MPSSPVEANDDSVQIPTPISLPSPHQLCPPEEDRDYHAPREERLEIIGQSPPNANATPTGLPTPGPDNDVEQSTVEDPVIMEDVTKHVECLDNTLTREPPKYPVPFPFPAEDVRDSDAHLAQSMSAAALSSELAQNLEHNPSHRHRVGELFYREIPEAYSYYRSRPTLHRPFYGRAASFKAHSSQIDRCTTCKWR